jgi:hypothetical protein
MSEELDQGAERRAFLKAAGKFAVTVPPAMTFLLTTSLSSNAIATSNNTSNSAANEQEFNQFTAPGGETAETFPLD